MSDHTVPILKKAIAVLRAVSEGRDDTTTKALAYSLGIPSSSVYRILQTFLAADWVRSAPGGRHELSLGLLPLLEPLARHEHLIDAARPCLARLAGETGLAAKLSVRQGDRAIALFRAESPRETAVSVRVGSAFHLSLGSSGAVLLSELPAPERERLLDEASADCWRHQSRQDLEKRINDCRRNGYCADFGGYQPSVHALSAPVRGRDDEIVGVFTIVGFAHDFSGRQNKLLVKALLAAVADCSQALRGNSPFSDAA